MRGRRQGRKSPSSPKSRERLALLVLKKALKRVDSLGFSAWIDLHDGNDAPVEMSELHLFDTSVSGILERSRCQEFLIRSKEKT